MSELPEYSIDVQGLVRTFGAFHAVDGVSFRVRPGEIFGFLGANGAGKSTTIRMLCGLLAPSGGRAFVAGIDVGKDPEGVKRSIGYMSQRFSLYDDLTVAENLRFFGTAYGLGKARLAERSAWVLRTIGLEGYEDRLTGTLSTGWKQRLALGCAVLHEPRIVFLDEPTGGVDPIARRRFWSLIHELAGSGITILVTTHYLDEAEYCEHIVLIQDGRLIADGSPNELKNRYIKAMLMEVVCEDPVAALELLRDLPEVVEVSLFGVRLHVGLKEHDESLGEAFIRQVLNDADVGVSHVTRVMPSLEDVFLYLVEGKAGNEVPIQ